MFNRRLFLLILALGFVLGILIWRWNEVPGIPLKSASGPVSTTRWSMDLAGQWELYPTLRQAWITESEKAKNEVDQSLTRLTSGSPMYLPSSTGFKVAAKTFKVPAEWNARTLMLQLNGVKGRLTVYLNGMESINRIGTIDSEGEIERLEIPIKALRYGEDNHIFLELKSPLSQEQTLFGTQYPVEGQIKGSIFLQAVMETSLENPKLQVNWEDDGAKVQVDFQLRHHGFSEYGPWTVQGILSDGSAEVARAEVKVNPNENPVQSLSMNFNIPNGRSWSPEDPFLYQLFLTVTNPKGDKDDLAFPIALSSIQFKEGIFRQNDKSLPIKGLAVLPEMENRVRETGAIRSWLEDSKGKGYNLLYFVGDFPDELWLYEADRIGVGIWAELPGNTITPTKRLSDPNAWEKLIRTGSLHPSLWAYTTGKGLEVNLEADVKNDLEAYKKEIQSLTNPTPAFSLRLTDSFAFEPEFSPRIEEENIQGTWGGIQLPKEVYEDSGNTWPQERWVRVVWLIIIVIITWANLAATHWRYKELNTKKPKRALRKAWLRMGWALFSREMTLAGILTSFLFYIEAPWAHWTPNQWPLWEAIRLQSPWLIWVILGLTFTLVRLLQVGIVAPHMPETPAPMGLALWLERRYLWNWTIALLWAAGPWGIPNYVPILTYIGLSVIFLPLKIRDVRRIGGRYSPFFIVPGFILATLSLVSLFRWEDVLYLWRLLQFYISG